MGFCTNDEYQEFLRTCPSFEDMLVGSGIHLTKFWFSVSEQEQARRFSRRVASPETRWKFSEMDLQSRTRWVDYSEAKDAMFAATDTEQSPWLVVEADDKRRARLNSINHLLRTIEYDEPEDQSIQIPPIQKRDYERPPRDGQTYVKDYLS